MWKEPARLASEDSATGPDGETQWIYLANSYTQRVKPGYQDDPVLFTRSACYSPKEL